MIMTSDYRYLKIIIITKITATAIATISYGYNVPKK